MIGAGKDPRDRGTGDAFEKRRKTMEIIEAKKVYEFAQSNEALSGLLWYEFDLKGSWEVDKQAWCELIVKHL